jgi:hypothetical protein
MTSKLTDSPHALSKNISDMQPKRVIIQHISIDEIRDEEGQSGVPITSNFKTLNDWLFSICDGDKPIKPIATYCLVLAEAEHERVLFLVGMNRDDVRTYVEFKPKKMTIS